MNIVPTQKLNILDTTDPFTQPGTLALSDGSYLFGYTTDREPGQMIWLRSQDNGNTWTNRGSGRGTGNFDYCFPTHGKNNVAVYPQFDYFYDSAHILTSTDGGATWTITATFDSAPTGAWECFAVCSCSLRNGGRLIVGGQFAASTSAPQELIAYSDNNGASWTSSNALTSDGQGSFCGALVATGGDTVFAVVNHFDDDTFHYTPILYRSDNGGNSWTNLGQLPLPSGAESALVHAATSPDASKLCMAGQCGGTSANGKASVWYTHDNGTTIHLVDASNINGFPAGASYPPTAYEIKRVTKDAVLLTFDTGDGASSNFFAMSLDGGQTYPIAPDAPSGGWESWTFGVGAITVTRNGRILVPAWRWPDYGTSYHQLYQCQVIC